MKFHDTNPKEPDWYENYQKYPYNIAVRVDFLQTDDRFVVNADLTEYYNWAIDNGIDMKHSIMVIPNNEGRGRVDFMLSTLEDKMAFKLSWL